MGSQAYGENQGCSVLGLIPTEMAASRHWKGFFTRDLGPKPECSGTQGTKLHTNSGAGTHPSPNHRPVSSRGWHLIQHWGVEALTESSSGRWRARHWGRHAATVGKHFEGMWGTPEIPGTIGETCDYWGIEINILQLGLEVGWGEGHKPVRYG